MDRRQRKTREAIFRAFVALLSEKNYNQITVAEVIERADIGRATFYAHFETKDYLLKELCQELFGHVFAPEDGAAHTHIFDCDTPDSAYVHLFRHLQKNDNYIRELLSSQNNELFLHYFRSSLTAYVRERLSLFEGRKNPGLPDDFWVHHIASTFVETVRWWIQGGMQQSPEQITKYFFMAV